MDLEEWMLHLAGRAIATLQRGVEVIKLSVQITNKKLNQKEITLIIEVLFWTDIYLQPTIDGILLDVMKILYYVFFINSSNHPNMLNAYARLASKMLSIPTKDEIFIISSC